MPAAGGKVRLGEVRAVVLFSERPRRLAEWYSRTLEAQEVFASDGFIGLALGAATLFIERASEGQVPGPGSVRPHFTVSDCQQAFQDLLRRGARPILAPTDVGDEHVAAVQDPDGNPIGLISFHR